MCRTPAIIHVTDSLALSMGGPPVAVAGLASAQAALGYDVIIVANEPPQDEQTIDDVISEFPGLENVKIHTVAHTSAVDRLAGRSAEKLFRGLVKSGDILHLHGLWRPIFKIASVVARKAGAHYVCAPLGMLHPWALRQKRIKKQLALYLGWRTVLRHASFVHVLNKDEGRYVESLGWGVKTRIIPNGIFPDVLSISPDAGRFTERHPALVGKSYVMFIGRLHYVKGLDFVAEAFSRVAADVADVDLVVAGPDGGQRENLLAAVRRNGIESRVHIVGPIYGEEKYAAMYGALCLFQPSRQEGFSMAITEAMACGLPVVISDQCHFPEVSAAGAGFVAPLDSVELAQELIKIIKNRTLRDSMGQAAKRLVAGSYTWPAIAANCIDAYREATDQFRIQRSTNY